MSFTIGQVLRGKHGTYKLVKGLKGSTVFKASTEPTEPTAASTARFAVVKTELESKQLQLRRERHNYTVSKVAKCDHFRRLIDVIEPPDNGPFDVEVAPKSPFSLVFEWMDEDLWNIPPELIRTHPNLAKAVAKSVLSALVVLNDVHATHTDVKPMNVFVSDVNAQYPNVKLGDLGVMCPAGYKQQRLQCLECRAPEVWRGLGCWPSSDVWSVGVTLAHFLVQKSIFGDVGKIIVDRTNEWCIAKLIRLVGPIGDGILDEGSVEKYKEEIEIARRLIHMDFTHWETGERQPTIPTDSLRTVLMNSPGPKIPADLLDFSDYLLVMDHTKRPTAAEALRHKFLMDDLGFFSSSV